MGDFFTVSSDLFNEINLEPVKCDNGRILSKFKYKYPRDIENNKENVRNTNKNIEDKNRIGIIEIECSRSTTLDLVGLQVWRGALLLADFLFHHRNELCDKQILELGSGVGLTSIAAGIYAMRVICTDVDLGEILPLIQSNCDRNRKLTRNAVKVIELDFEKETYTSELERYIERTDIIIAADVIYFDNLTDAFVTTLNRLLNKDKKPVVAYVALEKRSAFSTDADAIPPSYQYFLDKSSEMNWNIETLKLDFPQYFEYERCRKLVLLKITKKI